jgi:MFS family permease
MFFINGTLFATWVSRIPGIKETHGLSEASLSIALFALALGTFAALPITSWFIARYGSRRVTGVSAVASCVLLPLAGWMPSFPLLVALLAGFGAAMASMDVAMNSQASLLEKSAGRSIMSSLHGLWSLGGLVGSAIGVAFAAPGLSPFAQFLAVCAVLAVSATAAVGQLLRDDVKHAEPGQVLGWPSGAVMLLGLVGACAAVIEGGIADWGGVYLRDSLGSSPAFAAMGYGALSLTMMIGRFVGDRLIDRYGRVAVLRAGATLTGIALAMALSIGNVWVAIAAFAVAGLGMSAVFPIAFSAAGEMRGADRGNAIPAVATLAYGGQMLGPVIIGFTASVTSLPAALWLFVLMAGAIAVLARTATTGAKRDAIHEPPTSHF